MIPILQHLSLRLEENQADATQRRRRKSKAAALVARHKLGTNSASSPSATDNRSSYLGGENGSIQATHRQSAFGAIAGEADADADREEDNRRWTTCDWQGPWGAAQSRQSSSTK